MRSSVVGILSALAVAGAGLAGLASADAKSRKVDRPARDERPAVLDLAAASFTVKGVARTERCAKYDGCDHRHAVLVQHLRGEVFPNAPSDEMWSVFGDRRLFLRGRVLRTLRLDGPEGTPIGVHEGGVEIYTHLGDTELVVFRGEITGNSGFRSAAEGSDRCDDPRHEEGSIDGVFSVPTLKRLLDRDDVDHLVRGPKCRVRLTYEADHRLLDAGGADGGDACRWDAWTARADGVVVCRCPDAAVTDRTETHDEDLPETDAGDGQ